MKYVALALIAVGIMLIIYAIKADSTSSFDDGSFMIQIAAGGIGALSIVGGVVIIIMLAFMGLP